jgi:hypothetical protein
VVCVTVNVGCAKAIGDNNGGWGGLNVLEIRYTFGADSTVRLCVCYIAICVLSSVRV